MPKEVVYDGSEQFDIEIGWGLDQCVQVGIETHDKMPLVHKLGSLADEPAQFTGVWATLDRRQINRLIKMLRKARDEAYGRDE